MVSVADSAPTTADEETSQAAYHHLLSPLSIGRTTLPNRAVMGAMHTRLETLDRAPERIYAFYRARAEGEIGLILTGGVSPNPDGRIEDGAPVLDLDYSEDADCDTDMNVVMTDSGAFVELQGTGEGAPFTRQQLDALVTLASDGIREIVAMQKAALL